LLFLPLLLTVAMMVRIESPGPAIFRQRRTGYQGKIFTIFKFRTMTVTEDSGQIRQATKGDLRVTAIGAVLRKLSIDELPQLWNIVRGEMSLVGPRPLLTRYLPWFTERERLRHTVPPGVTGWAQLQGRNEVSWDERIGHDVWYVENRSLLRDLEILLATVGLVLRRDGVVVDARSTMLNFDEERQLRRDAAQNGQETRGGSG
jgi:sugar transferase EpsL